MPDIKIEITIPYFEYKEWSDFDDGIEQVMINLKNDIRCDLKARYIKTFVLKAEVID